MPNVPRAIHPVYRPVMVNPVCYLSVCWLLLFCCCVCFDFPLVLFSWLSIQCHVMGTKGLYIVFCALLPLCCLVSCPSHWVSVGRPSRVLSVKITPVFCMCRPSVSSCANRSMCRPSCVLFMCRPSDVLLATKLSP